MLSKWMHHLPRGCTITIWREAAPHILVNAFATSAYLSHITLDRKLTTLVLCAPLGHSSAES